MQQMQQMDRTHRGRPDAGLLVTVGFGASQGDFADQMDIDDG